MQFNDWEPTYLEILEDMGYDRDDDENSVRVLKAVTLNSDLVDDDILFELVHSKAVIIGDSPKLSEELDRGLPEGTIIASGSSVARLSEFKIIPDIVVTDLDGDIGSQIDASSKGSMTIIHAHGDNEDLIMRYAASFKGPVILSTQSKPENTVSNYGGFTDGDRAVCLARHFGAKEIFLVGFDFNDPNPKNGSDPIVKLRKLSWAKKIIFDMNPKDVTIHWS